jgi:SET domain-containing protein
MTESVELSSGTAAEPPDDVVVGGLSLSAFKGLHSSFSSPSMTSSSSRSDPDSVSGSDVSEEEPALLPIEEYSTESLHPDVEVRKSAIGGYGLFAIRDIPEGAVVWEEKEPEANRKVVSIEDILKLTDKKQQKLMVHYGIQVSSIHMVGDWTSDFTTADASNFHNHSCDPNTWFDGDYKITARRDIKAGEEITYDYATSDTFEWPGAIGGMQTVKCNCGAVLCRGAVRPDDWKRPDLRERYKDHWLSYIVRMIEQDSESTHV